MIRSSACPHSVFATLSLLHICVLVCVNCYYSFGAGQLEVVTTTDLEPDLKMSQVCALFHHRDGPRRKERHEEETEGKGNLDCHHGELRR